MKRCLRLIIALLLVAVTSLQLQAKKHPFVMEGKKWVFINEHPLKRITYMIKGDTLIDGSPYMKIFRSVDDGESVYHGAVSENGAKVYIVFANQKEKEIVYDCSENIDNPIHLACGLTLKAYPLRKVEIDGEPYNLTSYYYLPNVDGVVPLEYNLCLEGFGCLSIDFLSKDPAEASRLIFYSCSENGVDFSEIVTNCDWLPEYIDSEVSFLKEGKRWVFHRTNDWNAGYDYSYTVEGDTLIGDKAYKKVYEVNEFSYKDNQPHYRAALREDGPTVFMVDRDHPAEDEHLLYDFEQGETYLYDEIVHQCVAQDEISVRGRNYRRMTIRELSEEDRQGSDMFLVEGIGLQYCDLLEPCGWTYPGSFVTSMLSCWEGDECIFTLSDFDGSAPTGISDSQYDVSAELLQGVYDLQGRLVSRGYGGTGLAPSHPRTPIPSMKKGVYIVSGRKYVVK